MALKKSASRKCPVCVTFGDYPEKIEQINKALEPILADIKETGEVPKAKDPRFGTLAVALSITPFALQFHTRQCLVTREIDDQMMLEFRDALDALHTAKVEYKENPTQPYANAMGVIHGMVMKMYEHMTKDHDPELAVQFVAETVIGHVMRHSLGVFAKEARAINESVANYLPPTHKAAVKKAVESSLLATSNALQESAQEALDNVCNYYKVELDVAAKKAALATVTLPPHPEKKTG